MFSDALARGLWLILMSRCGYINMSNILCVSTLLFPREMDKNLLFHDTEMPHHLHFNKHVRAALQTFKSQRGVVNSSGVGGDLNAGLR